MRRYLAIVKATALELLSEPLFLLVTTGAMALAVLAPAFHYHQFGEPSRMARDAGVSAILLGGLVLAGFGALRTMRREIESQTAFSALALPVSRRCFFLAKVSGTALAYLFFLAAVGAVSSAAVRGAVIGGEIALQGGMARMYGPSLAFAVAAIVVPFLYGAFVNRFSRLRFTLHANCCALVLALAAACYRFDGALALRLYPVYVLVALPALVLLAGSAAFAAKFRFNVASALALVVFALFAPALGSYCLSDMLSDGGSVPWGYFLAACAAVVPPVAALLALGSALFSSEG